MNIVFSTTRQWNPGDEFILLGTINLLKEFFEIDFNTIIYNRNPQIRRARKRDIIKSIDNFFGKELLEKFRDNSVKDKMNLDFADLVVFAGSPEWSGRRLLKLYDEILKNKIPCIFLGIGTDSKVPIEYNEKNFTQLEREVYESLTKMIVCRDLNTFNAFKDFRFSMQLPCPALFSSNKEKKIVSVKKIALIYSTSNAEGGNDVSFDTYEYLLKLYNYILKEFKDKFEIEFVAHYIDEIPEFKKDFPSYKLFYSYDSKDYLDIYNKYDLVIGCRVHGIGMSASLGIPGIMIAHDKRAETVKGFLAERIDVNQDLHSVNNIILDQIENIQDKSEEIISHKNITRVKYLNLFKKNNL